MCHAPFSHDKHVNENMSNMSRHVIIPWSKSGLKTIKWSEIWSETSATPPFHMISMSTKTCQTYIENLKLVGSVQRGSNPDQNVKFNQYKKAGSSGAKGRVRSNSIYIENLKLVGSVQRSSNPDQNVNFNQYKNAGSSGVKGRVRSNSIYIENLKLVGSVQRGSNPD